MWPESKSKDRRSPVMKVVRQPTSRQYVIRIVWYNSCGARTNGDGINHQSREWCRRSLSQHLTCRAVRPRYGMFESFFFKYVTPEKDMDQKEPHEGVKIRVHPIPLTERR